MGKAQKQSTAARKRARGPKPFACDQCEKSFASEGNLRRHQASKPGHAMTAAGGAYEQIDIPPTSLPSLAEQAQEMDVDCTPEELTQEFGVDDDDRARRADELDGETFVERYPGAGRIKRYDPRPDTVLEDAAQAENLQHWPFNASHDLKFANWVFSESVSKAGLDRLLDIEEIRERLGLSFKNSRQLQQIVEKIPSRAAFKKTEIDIAGIPDDIYVLHRDSADCLKDLWSRISLHGKIKFAPEKHWTDASRTSRKYSAYHTADHMWRCQAKLPDGATVAAIIIFVDKTQLCTIVGDSKAYPVYMTVANIDPITRRNISTGAHILVGYLPIVSFENTEFSDDVVRNLRLRIFHIAMGIIFESLREASKTGIELVSADGAVRDCYPILAISALDNPEQCQHTLAKFGVSCPKCKAVKEDFSTNMPFEPRDPADTLRHIRHASNLGSFTAAVDYLKKYGLNYVLTPYWEDWAHVDIHESISPDILHQLLQGVLKHVIAWLTKLIGEKEMDAHFARQLKSYGVRHFKSGISGLQRVSGTEHKAMASQLLPVIADATTDKRVVRATRGLLDFLYISQYTCHSDETLDIDLRGALTMFFENMDVFVELGVCDSLDLPKIHSMQHYIAPIKLFGEANQYNTEIGERLHIDFAKDAFEASNKKRDQYLEQMCKWLDCRERMLFLNHWLAHRNNTTFDPRKRVDKRKHAAMEFTKEPSGGYQTLVDLSVAHHAPGIQDAVNDFLEDYCGNEWADLYPDVDAPEFPKVRLDAKLSVWHNVKFYTPDLQTLEAPDTRDIAYAAPARSRKQPDPDDPDDQLEARFSPVLVKKDDVAGIGGTDGLRVAHLRVIFELPTSTLLALERLGLENPGKLAFVQWYTKLGRRDPDTDMFKVKHDMRYVAGAGAAKQRSASVIEALDIRRSCHLAPRLPRSIRSFPRELTAENVLEDWDGEYWLNHYIDKPMYRSML